MSYDHTEPRWHDIVSSLKIKIRHILGGNESIHNVVWSSISSAYHRGVDDGRKNCGCAPRDRPYSPFDPDN